MTTSSAPRSGPDDRRRSPAGVPASLETRTAGIEASFEESVERVVGELAARVRDLSAAVDSSHAGLTETLDERTKRFARDIDHNAGTVLSAVENALSLLIQGLDGRGTALRDAVESARSAILDGLDDRVVSMRRMVDASESSLIADLDDRAGRIASTLESGNATILSTLETRIAALRQALIESDGFLATAMDERRDNLTSAIEDVAGSLAATLGDRADDVRRVLEQSAGNVTHCAGNQARGDRSRAGRRNREPCRGGGRADGSDHRQPRARPWQCRAHALGSHLDDRRHAAGIDRGGFRHDGRGSRSRPRRSRDRDAEIAIIIGELGSTFRASSAEAQSEFVAEAERFEERIRAVVPVRSGNEPGRTQRTHRRERTDRRGYRPLRRVDPPCRPGSAGALSLPRPSSSVARSPTWAGRMRADAEELREALALEGDAFTTQIGGASLAMRSEAETARERLSEGRERVRRRSGGDGRPSACRRGGCTRNRPAAGGIAVRRHRQRVRSPASDR